MGSDGGQRPSCWHWGLASSVIGCSDVRQSCISERDARRCRQREYLAIRRAAVNDIAPSRYKWVGTRPIRPDGVPKVTGRALYGADFATAGTLYGKVIRSPHAHARIRSIDASKALALPGVRAVVNSADFPDQKFEDEGPERVSQNMWHITRNIIAREKALYEGHPVAAVAAIG